jgi:hypothetical protein
MNDEKPFLTEDHGTWGLLSDGSVVLVGHPLLMPSQSGRQTPAAPKEPAGRVIRREAFDSMPHQERWKVYRDGIQIVD